MAGIKWQKYYSNFTTYLGASGRDYIRSLLFEAVEELFKAYFDPNEGVVPVDTGNLSETLIQSIKKTTKMIGLDMNIVNANAYYWKYVNNGTYAISPHYFIEGTLNAGKELLNRISGEVFEEVVELCDGNISNSAIKNVVLKSYVKAIKKENKKMFSKIDKKYSKKAVNNIIRNSRK